MRVLAHPFGFDGDGAVRTVEQWTDGELLQLVRAITSTVVGERPLAPLFGITDPAGREVVPDEIKAAVSVCEPDIRVVGVTSTGPTQQVQHMRVSAVWVDDEE